MTESHSCIAYQGGSSRRGKPQLWKGSEGSIDSVFPDKATRCWFFRDRQEALIQVRNSHGALTEAFRFVRVMRPRDHIKVNT